ncbi:MAG TPA: hypothetical protein VIM33_16045 [Gaiellaceae bacterium]
MSALVSGYGNKNLLPQPAPVEVVADRVPWRLASLVRRAIKIVHRYDGHALRGC